jgi:hypothetical protein
VIAVAPGSFQSEMGCAGDWDPGCLRSWLQDPDGDGIYSFVADNIPAGDYEAKVALNESWDVNYGAGGELNGANIAFSVEVGDDVTFGYDATTHVLTITAAPPVLPQPTSVTIAGSLQSELGCSGDWQPDCAATHLAFDPDDLAWQATFAVPAGSFEYKAPLNTAGTKLRRQRHPQWHEHPVNRRPADVSSITRTRRTGSPATEMRRSRLRL